MTKILLIEDHALVREAMCQSLRRLDEGETQCSEAMDAAQAFKKLDEEEWDIVLLDLMLPDLSGFSLLATITRKYPDLPVIIVSALNDDVSIGRAIKGGASGFIHKSMSGDRMLEAVREVLSGGSCFAESALQQGGKSRKTSFAEQHGLTLAQNRVMELLAEGKTNRQIGQILGISEGTVKVHVSSILRQVQVPNRAQAILAFKAYKGH
jgi:DNA-binding NarL/FixJ family response regulator